jgi:PTS system nitrogen regulatory IIA component
MRLRIRDAAELLEVSENTISRWTKAHKLPALKIKGQYRFNREELLEFATTRQTRVSPSAFAKLAGLESDPGASLADALRAGEVYYGLEGNKESVVRAAFGLTPFPKGVDREFFLRVLLAGESLGATAVGGGIAIPQVRNPIVLNIPHPIVTLCFLKHPIDCGAWDKEPVHTIFTLFSPTIPAHLRLVSKLAYALHHDGFSDAIVRQASRDEILEKAAQVDRSIPAITEDK